jgi:molybdopterin molybdotransferase
MLSVADAQALVLEQARPLPPQQLSLTPAALGLVLTEDVASDLDMPPYDKALMDGYAIRAAELGEGKGTFAVIEEITAGQTPRLSLGPGQASRIMTGAPVPAGADAVIMIERTQLLEGNKVRIEDKPPKPGQNVLAKGREMRQGETVLSRGAVIEPQTLGLLAAVGRTSALLQPSPDVAVISTGDEVVEASERPGPSQIRNGNGPMLLAQVSRAGGVSRFLGIARDRMDSLGPLVAEGLRSSLLVLSGGVSAGKLDLVPGVLTELGVKTHFHKVEMKPGKPVLFGTREATLVFGLPGNPVSALVCFELFVRPAIRRLRGLADPGPRMDPAVLAEDFAYATDRPTYYPVRLERSASVTRFVPLPWFGSADLRGLLNAEAFALFPSGAHQHRAGQQFPVLRVDGY